MCEFNQATTRGRIPLLQIEAAVAARLGSGRVSGNAQPAAFSRQVAMYLASQVGGWSTTQIGKFYNCPDHSTVCYAIGRIRALRETDPEVDGLVTVLTNELRERAPRKRKPTTQPDTLSPARTVGPLVDEGVLDALAERIANRVVSKLRRPHLAAIAPAAELTPKVAEALAAARE
jgi:Bacterial dnaA protein helix-turn-helix